MQASIRSPLEVIALVCPDQAEQIEARLIKALEFAPGTMIWIEDNHLAWCHEASEGEVKEGGTTETAREALHEHEVTDYQWEQINRGTCPDCLGRLLKGPRGGEAMNVACSQCGEGFWVGGPFRPQRIGKRPEAISLIPSVWITS